MASGAILSSDAVVQRGVPAETVQQLQLMNTYLLDNFQISLQYADERPAQPGPPHAPPFDDWRSREQTRSTNPAQFDNSQSHDRSANFNDRNAFPRASSTGNGRGDFAGDRRDPWPPRDTRGASSNHAPPAPAPKIERFAVPASICGGLIGKGGEYIHSLGREFSVHIDISKAVHPVNNTREVTLSALDVRDGDAERNLQACKQRMVQAVQSLL